MMPPDNKWTRSNTAFVIVMLLLIITGWLIISRWNIWIAADSPAPPRPTTINNVVLRIESNVIRIQTAMQNLVFSEYPSDLAKGVKTVNELEGSIKKDFDAMGEHFSGGNPQYLNALVLFREWKDIRDEVIRLTTAGPSPRAKIIVRGKCAAHAMKLRSALMVLNRFSEKRADDFDSAAFAAAREKNVSK